MAQSHIVNDQGLYQNLHTPALIIGGFFVVVSLSLSCFLILQHLRSYTNPAEQKSIIGVLLMVPIYSTESIISLWNTRFSVACDILRNCYEAFALYSFGRYLVACLGGEERVVAHLENETREQLTEPLIHEKQESRNKLCDFFCQPRLLGRDFYTIVKFGIVQYMILKTLCAFLALILELFGVYGDGEFKWYYGYPYIAVVLNFGQMWALYCLVQFYNLTHCRLEEIKPLAKFVSFKAIVFATWWQGVGIAIICYFEVLPNEEKFQHFIQDFLICVEMAIAALAHVFVFSEKPYKFQPISEPGEITVEETKMEVKIEGGGEDSEKKPTAVEEKETLIEAPGTSVKESVQDVVVGGGERVVKDVVLTITQAVQPVEKGVSKIQEKFNHMKVESESEEGEGRKVELEEHVKEDITEVEPHVVSSEKVVKTS